MIEYRVFRNPDPPALLETWNSCFQGRATAVLQSSLLLEYFTFAKPYFDPAGFIIAVEGDQIVGFIHASFASNPDHTVLDKEVGVICSLGVQPEHRQKGVGKELLHRAEAYLEAQGAKKILAGPMQRESNPFTFGLYGGGGSPGFLESDENSRAFLEHHGYQISSSRLVFQKRLDQPLNIVDPRFAEYRNRFEIHAAPLHTHWWNECVLGPLELHDFRLNEKESKEVRARCALWEMDTFNPSWQQYAVGIFHLEVEENQRRQGFARFLLSQIMRHLQEQYFSLMELQVAENDEPSLGLAASLGFEQVDIGHQYILQTDESSA